MKKVLQMISGVLCCLIVAAVFIVPIVRGIMFEDERIVMWIAIGILVLIVLTIIISIKYTAYVKRRATAQTSGVIIRARRQLGGDESDTDDGWWIRIRFCVDQQEYQINKNVRLSFGTNAKQYVNRTVTVHYDPNHPKTAWAEWPWEKSK